MTEPFRLHPGTLQEGDIQAQIIDYLRHEQARDRVIWFERSNGGGGRVGARWVWFYRLICRIVRSEHEQTIRSENQSRLQR